MKTKRKEKLQVALFINYGSNAELGVRKEEKLKEYCKNNNFKITRIYRTEELNSKDFISISSIMTDLEDERVDFQVVLGYTIDDFSDNDMAELIVALKILQDFAKLNVVTLKEGIIGEDYLIKFTPSFNIKNKKELDISNNPYLDEELEKVNP